MAAAKFPHGVGSGDFRDFYGRVALMRGAIGSNLAPDSFNMPNPRIITDPIAKSKCLYDGKVGVLGGTCAFVRFDAGNGCMGGPVKILGAYHPKIYPIGIFINDAVGNAYENQPGAASGQGPYYKSGTMGVRIFETQVQISGGGRFIGEDLVYVPGDTLYASVNGLLTNRYEDAYNTLSGGVDNTLGVLKIAPTDYKSIMVLDTPY